MASSLRLILSAILFLSLIQSGNAKTSTENLIVNKSDILGLKKSTEIEEGDFFESIQVNSDSYVWIVNLKNGPFPTKEKANQAALELKKRLGISLPKLTKEISILRKSKSPNNKNFNKAKFSWMITLSLGVYDSKDKALQIAQEIKAIQKVPENIFLTRKSKDIKISNFSEKITPEVSGKIFLSSVATPIKNKTKHLILVATRSNSLYVRKNPSSSSPVVASLLRGSKVPHIKNNAPENRDGGWFYVEYSKGKFGWVSSSYTKKIIDTGSRISQQANLKTAKPKKIQTSQAPRSSEFRKLKSLVALLQTELNKIKTNKARAIESTNQANAKTKNERLASIKEFNALKEKSSKEIKNLQETTILLSSELNLIKLDKAKAIKAANQANAKIKNESLASIKEFENLKQKSFKQIKDLQITTASLRSELMLIKLDKAKAIEAANQANTRTKKEKLANIREFENLKQKSFKQIKDLQITTASLRTELNLIKLDKAKAIEATNQANSKAKEEKLANSSEKNALQEKINTLRVVLEKFKSDREKTTQATNQANIKVREEKLASVKEFNTLKEKSSTQIKDLQTTTVSLSSELDKIKSDKDKANEATNQANSKAEEERIASIQKFNALKEKNSKQIKDLQTTTVSLRSELAKIKSDKDKAIEAATNQIISKSKEERIASIQKFNTLKEKSSKQIKDLQTTTVSLRSELDKANSEKTKAIEATNQANTKANEERLASIKEFRSLNEKSSKQINDLQKTTVSLSSELDMIIANKARAIEATNQANTKAKEERLADANEKNALQDKINTLRIVLDKFKIDKEKTTQATNQANSRAKEERLASIKEFKLLKEKSSNQIKDLQATTVSLSSELDKIKASKANAFETSDQASSSLQAQKLTNAKLVASLKVNNEKEILNLREKKDNEIKNLKNKTLKEITDLKFSTASLQKELQKIKGDKENAINAIDQTNAKFNAEKLANAKLVASLNAENKKRVDELKFSTASLQKELQKIKGDKEDAINAFDQSNAKLQTTKLNNIEFTNQLKDTVIFLRKQLDKLKAEKLDNSVKISRIKETSHKKILDLQTIVASQRSELNKTKDDMTNKLTAIKQANIKANKMFKESSSSEIKTLNSTINNLRTVLEKFKIEKLKTAETTKSRETKIATERTIREKEINVLKKESTALKQELDKASLDRVRGMEGINRDNSEVRADHIALDNEFKEFRQKSAREIADLRDEGTALRNQLAHLKAERTKTIQPKTLLSSTKKLRGLSSSASSKQKNKTAGTLDKLNKKKAIAEKKLLPPPTDSNPESIINSNLTNWIKAWESQNIPLYLSFYSKSFMDPKRSRSKWEAYRRKSIENTSNISIQISNIKSYIDNDKIIRVTFIQRFKSQRFSDVGLKELVWKKGTKNWKIIKETWKPR